MTSSVINSKGKNSPPSRASSACLLVRSDSEWSSTGRSRDYRRSIINSSSIFNSSRHHLFIRFLLWWNMKIIQTQKQQESQWSIITADRSNGTWTHHRHLLTLNQKDQRTQKIIRHLVTNSCYCSDLLFLITSSSSPSSSPSLHPPPLHPSYLLYPDHLLLLYIFLTSSTWSPPLHPPPLLLTSSTWSPPPPPLLYILTSSTRSHLFSFSTSSYLLNLITSCFPSLPPFLLITSFSVSSSFPFSFSIWSPPPPLPPFLLWLLLQQ